MERQNFDRGWEFDFNDDKAIVDLPHDYSVIQPRIADSRTKGDGGYFQGGDAVYKKAFFVPENWQDHTVMLEFEGVYMNANVRVNGNLVAFHPYGYSTFHCDITRYLHFGKDNIVTVNVNNNALPNSRWYTGSGIYRHIWLLTGESAYIQPNGICVTTAVITDDCADVSIVTELGGENAAGAAVCSVIFDCSGSEVAITDKETATVKNPVLWSIENPYLYTLRSQVYVDNVLADTVETKFGIRSIEMDAKKGLRLNGKPLKLKGGCVHHDCGILGAAAFDRAEQRKVELLKQNGFNAVRCAHNPPSPAFLDACDRLGMLVIDEIFDMWREKKKDYDYHLYFEDWWKRDMAAMILRDRNHPSVIMWSTGNEIQEAGGCSDGFAIAKKLANYARSLDSTRFITNALCEWATSTDEHSPDKGWAKNSESFSTTLDVVGYNYLIGNYGTDAVQFPNRVIYGGEIMAKDMFDGWEAVKRYPHVIGDFVWTAIDYFGESGIGRHRAEGDREHTGAYPWHQAFCGDIDICGFKRPQSYYRDFVWGRGKEPYIAVHRLDAIPNSTPYEWAWDNVVGRWTWEGYEGNPVKIDVYSGGDEAELFLNGQSLGKKPAGKQARYIAAFEAVYTAGELLAVTYENGKETLRSSLKTAGKPSRIRLTADRLKLEHFDDLAYVSVEIVDRHGNLAQQVNSQLYFTVSGSGVLQAIGNSDSESEEMYVGAARKAHEGRALAIIRAKDAGETVLSVSAEGLPAAEIRINL